MRRTARVALAGSLAVAIAFGDVAGATAGDQASADAAIAEFNARMLAAGWTSQGPLSTGEDDDEWGDCFEGYWFVLASTEEDPAEGVTARADSDQFTFAPPNGTDPPASSEPPWASDTDEESAGALVLTVDDAHREEIAGLVDRLGSKDTARCVQALLSGDESVDTDDTTFGSQMREVTVTAEADRGIGDASSRLELRIEGEIFDEPFAFGVTFAAARTDRTLAVVFYGGNTLTDERPSGFDPEAELEALVDSLGG